MSRIKIKKIINQAAILSLSIAFVLLASCSKEESPTKPEDGGRLIPLSFKPSINVMADVEKTRAAISGSEFGRGTFDFGMFVVKHEDVPANYEPQLSGYSNLKATMTGVGGVMEGYAYSWSYVLNGVLGTVDVIGTDFGQAVDFYVYYPYIAGSDFNPRTVPFTSGSNDYMWSPAIPNLQSLAVGDGISVDLSFKHVMSLLQFKVRKLYTGNITLTAIKITDSQNRLIAGGTYDATTGVVTGNAPVGEIVVPFNTSIVSGYGFFPVMIPGIEEGINTDDIEITLILNGVEALQSFKLPLSMLQYNDGSTKHGIRTGYCYTVNVDIDNYIKFEPIGVTPWDYTPIEEEIEL